MAGEALILIGASVRAAAFSALRAGLRPWCADLFGDVDLRQRCPCAVLPTDRYPAGFVELVRSAPPGPWMFTGGLENAWRALQPLWQDRPCWGNCPQTLAQIRSPFLVEDILRQAGLPVPRTCSPSKQPLGEGRWLLKPLRGAGGSGIRSWSCAVSLPHPSKRYYLQEFIEGESGAAVFLAAPERTSLLGVSRQLVGQPWLHARDFHYCGSVGPWDISQAARNTLGELGSTLTRATGLRGLFGIDFILRDDIPWLIEVNPRYTASVEVLEYAAGLKSLELQRQVFTRDRSSPPEPISSDRCVAKGIYFAPHTLAVPPQGPWLEPMHRLTPIEELPTFADIPFSGQVIEAGRPMLTLFASGDSEAACLDGLRTLADSLDAILRGC